MSDRCRRKDPAPGDRWRTPWGVRTLVDVDGSRDIVVFGDGERMTGEDFKWMTRFDGGWVEVQDA